MSFILNYLRNIRQFTNCSQRLRKAYPLGAIFKMTPVSRYSFPKFATKYMGVPVTFVLQFITKRSAKERKGLQCIFTESFLAQSSEVILGGYALPTHQLQLVNYNMCQFLTSSLCIFQLIVQVMFVASSNPDQGLQLCYLLQATLKNYVWSKKKYTPI